MTFKPKFMAGILFILALSLTITVSMVTGIWKIEERHGREGFGGPGNGKGYMGGRNQLSATKANADPKEMLLIDWCFENEASPDCVSEKLGLGFEDMEKTLAQISASKGVESNTLIQMASGCIGSGSGHFEGGDNREEDTDKDED